MSLTEQVEKVGSATAAGAKWAIDIDTRKVALFVTAITLISVAIVTKEFPLTNMVPDNWIPHIEAWALFFAWFGPAFGFTHNVAALMSPRKD
jgi:hypothetical protein